MPPKRAAGKVLDVDPAVTPTGQPSSNKRSRSNATKASNSDLSQQETPTPAARKPAAAGPRKSNSTTARKTTTPAAKPSAKTLNAATTPSPSDIPGDLPLPVTPAGRKSKTSHAKSSAPKLPSPPTIKHPTSPFDLLVEAAILIDESSNEADENDDPDARAFSQDGAYDQGNASDQDVAYAQDDDEESPAIEGGEADAASQADGDAQPGGGKKRGRPKKVASSPDEMLVNQRAYLYFNGLDESFPALAKYKLDVILAAEAKTGVLSQAGRLWAVSEEVELFKFVDDDLAGKPTAAQLAQRMQEVSARRPYSAEGIRERLRFVVGELKVAQDYIDTKLSGLGGLELTQHGFRIREYVEREEEASETKSLISAKKEDEGRRELHMIAASTKSQRTTKQQQWDSGSNRPNKKPDRELPQDAIVDDKPAEKSKTSKAPVVTVAESLQNITDMLASVTSAEQQKIQLFASLLDPARADDGIQARINSLEVSMANFEQGQNQILSLLQTMMASQQNRMV